MSLCQHQTLKEIKFAHLNAMQAVTHASALVLQQPSRIRVGEGNRTEWRLFGVEKLFGVEISRVSALGEVYLSRC
jgi:hypothetical protein